jgi:hypothetical protein
MHHTHTSSLSSFIHLLNQQSKAASKGKQAKAKQK